MDDDIEFEPPAAMPAEPPSAGTPPPLRPRLHPAISILCWIAVGGWTAMLLVATFTGTPLDYLDHPAAAVIAVGERDLDLDTAVRAAPAWEQAAYRLLGYSAEGGCRETADGYRRVANYLAALEPPSGPAAAETSLLARLVVVEAEHGDQQRLDEALRWLPPTEAAARFADAVRYAYRGTPPTRAPPDSGWDLSLLSARDPRIDGPAWSRHRLRERLAERDGDQDEAARLRGETLQRGNRLLRRGRVLEAVYVFALLAGASIILAWLARRRRSLAVAHGMVVAPWSPRYGFAVIARCVAAAGAITFLLREPLFLWATLLTGLPMLLIMHRYLLQPDRTTLGEAFGLAPGSLSARGVLLFGLALVAVDQAGCLLIRNLADLAGLAAPWEEGIDETLLFRPLPIALFAAVDGIAWAPLFEEIAFRGLLYVTLRTRLPPLPAALLSGAAFGLLHLYSLAACLEVAWTGFILALGYEKCRSLWPGIFAHFFNNLLFYTASIVIYR